jgi:hypothetical protein
MPVFGTLSFLEYGCGWHSSFIKLFLRFVHLAQVSATIPCFPTRLGQQGTVSMDHLISIRALKSGSPDDLIP